jgi:oxaloacetate decarboxylase
MHWTDRRERFRAVLAGDACIHPASVFDAMSARIAEDLGFEVGMFAGSVGSLSVLGAPDIIVLTLTEFAAQAYRINRAGKLPLLVDADHGYGNALNVRRTVEELETAGVAAMTIEDTVLPRPYGDGRTRLIPIEEGVGKMKAGLAGRQDKSLVFVARTSAPSVTGIEDTIARIQAYEKTGVDAIFLVGIQTKAQLEAVSAAVKLPILLGSTGPELKDRAYLASQRVRISLVGHQPIMAAVQAVHDTLKAIREGTPPGELKNVASAELMNRVTRAADYESGTKDWLTGP